MSLKIFITSIALGSAFWFSSRAWAGPVQIYFKTTPAAERLRPLGDAAIFSVLVTGADGKPLTEGWADIRLDAPVAGRIFSTDFPLVEGTRLAEMRLPLTGRRLEWKYTLPIRGEYRLTVNVVSEGEKKASKSFQFDVRENKNKWIFLTLFILILFVAGFVAGRSFSPPVDPAKKIGMLIFLFLVGFFIPTGSPAAAVSAETNYVGRVEIEPAAVGKASKVRWRLEGEGPVVKSLALLNLSIVHKEKESSVFAIERLPVREQFEMAFQFTDATDYRVTASAAVSGIGLVQAEQSITASGTEPPMTAQLPAMLLFLAVVAGGLAAGRWSRHRPRAS